MTTTQLLLSLSVVSAVSSSALLSGKPSTLPVPSFLTLSLHRLSSDLYNKKTHFLLEFIQNADDNTYADGVIPSLNLWIEDSLIVFECNELGFSADNVRAICDIGASTKTPENSTRGFIGASSSHVKMRIYIHICACRREGYWLQVCLHRRQRGPHLFRPLHLPL
jgi:hypothetical protein